MLILSLGERPHTVRAPEHCTHDLTDEPKTQPHTFISKDLDEEKNGYEAIDQLLYMHYIEGLDSCQESLIWHQREVT